MKPKHHGGYGALHTELCERTLVTLFRGLGPWKAGIYVIGGLVPHFLITAKDADEPGPPPYVGTTDVDLVLDVAFLADIDAYRRLEQNLRALGFERGTNDDGRAQHFSWRKPVGDGITVVVDLLCDAEIAEGGQVVTLPGERRLSALKIPGAHLVIQDAVSIEVTAALLDERGDATETVRVSGIVPFLVLKALAYEDRFEEKDAHDLVYCLMHYGDGPAATAAQFATSMATAPDDNLFQLALDIMKRRFATDDQIRGERKDGPTSYARFLTDPGRRNLDARHRQDATAVVEVFLQAVAWERQRLRDA